MTRVYSFSGNMMAFHMTDQGNDVAVVLLDVLNGGVGIVLLTLQSSSVQLVVNDDERVDDDPQWTSG